MEAQGFEFDVVVHAFENISVTNLSSTILNIYECLTEELRIDSHVSIGALCKAWSGLDGDPGPDYEGDFLAWIATLKMERLDPKPISTRPNALFIVPASEELSAFRTSAPTRILEPGTKTTFDERQNMAVLLKQFSSGDSRYFESFLRRRCEG